ncbi:MAG: polyphosphate kinase 2 family protein [Candidatus Sericytochromatia bacterium]
MTDCWDRDARNVLRFRPGTKVVDLDTNSTPGFSGEKDDAPAIQDERNERFAELQELLYANSRSDEGARRAVLLVLQGMDTSGKGGIVKHVVGAGNPQGIRYTAFGVPNEEEREHHYLWRISRAVPAFGMIGVFDRSHYEDVLVVRVHNLVPPEVWNSRYEEINAFERELAGEGIALVKVAMFISLDEQKKRLGERLERPDKYWKYNPGDIQERKEWPEYQEAYQAMLDRTSTDYAPWYVVPSDKKWYSRLAVTELLIGALEDLDLSYPPPDFNVKAEKRRLTES